MTTQTKSLASATNTNETQAARDGETISIMPTMITKETKLVNDQSDDTDSEYQSKVNDKTQPLTVQLSTTDYSGVRSTIFQHPSTKALFADETPMFPYFTTPFAPLDFHGFTQENVHWRWSKTKGTETRLFTLNMFASLHDVAMNFSDEENFRSSVLPYIERTRRHRISNGYHNSVLLRDTQRRFLQVKARAKDGKMRWANVSLMINDFCALMGNGGLAKYATNVAISMPSKDLFTKEEKSCMQQMLLNRDPRFASYAEGDVVGYDGETKVQLLKTIFTKVVQHINSIADLFGVSHRLSWGMSTGTIVAHLVSDVIAKDLGVTIEQLSILTNNGGSDSLLDLAKLLKVKDSAVYLAMVEGGRATSERLLPPGIRHESSYINRKVKGVYTGVLCDIDISGCYGNGLLNQLLPIGIPDVIFKPMSLRDFTFKVHPKCVPSCWYARINWKNAPFDCDLIVSKVGESFRSWDWAVDGFRANDELPYEDPEGKVYEASMALYTREVHQGALTHDVLQALQEISSRSEWRWLLDNATVTGVIYYDKANQVDNVTEAMLEGSQSSQESNVVVSGSKQWIAYPLARIVNVLIPKRMEAKRLHGKKSPQQEFLKLVINTIYGCIASRFFNNKESCISNVVAGNNITARARVLAWTMAKGLGCFQLITDGGMFDINSVLKWNKSRISLDSLSKSYADRRYDDNRNETYKRVPLLNRILTEDDLHECVANKRWTSEARGNGDWNKPVDTSYLQEEIDTAAWEHLKQTFPALDIFANDQFWFESKRMFTGFTPHNKVDYRMANVVVGDNTGEYFVTFRGLRTELHEEYAHPLFDAYERNEPLMLTVTGEKLLSVTDWRELSDPLMQATLLPWDVVSETKNYYSITPLSTRFSTQAEYIAVDMQYQKAKEAEENRAELVASITPIANEKIQKQVQRKLARIK